MQNTLELYNPIMVDGKLISKVTYDTEKVTAQQFAQADAYKLRAARSSTAGTMAGISGAFEIDYGLHLYLGFQAIIAENPNFAMEDLERITGSDLVNIMRIGRNFISASPEASNSLQENSENSSEITPKPMDAVSTNSAKAD